MVTSPGKVPWFGVTVRDSSSVDVPLVATLTMASSTELVKGVPFVAHHESSMFPETATVEAPPAGFIHPITGACRKNAASAPIYFSTKGTVSLPLAHPGEMPFQSGSQTIPVRATV